MNIPFISTLWEIFIISLEVILFYLFICSKLHLKRVSSVFYSATFSYLFVQVIITFFCNYYSVSTLITIILSLVLNFIFCCCFFSATIFLSFFYSCIYSGICLFAEYITLTIPQFVAHINVSEILAGGTLRIPFSFLYVSLIAVFVFIFVNLFSEKIYLNANQKATYILISIVGISFSHYIMILTLRFTKDPLMDSVTNNLIIINLSFLTMFLALLLYIYQLGCTKEQNIQYLEKIMQQELEEKQYRILLNTTQSLREMKHDMKHHLEVIKLLVSKGDTQKLLDYVSTYTSSVEETHHLLSTGNTAIDCIMSAKLALAKQNNLIIEYSVIAPSPFPLDDITLSSLLGNILDNAIEACTTSISLDKSFVPYIYFYIKPFQNMVLIHCENNYSFEIRIDKNKNILSSKNSKNHGFGLKRIYDIISESDGIVQHSTNDNRFILHIMIPLKDEVPLNEH